MSDAIGYKKHEILNKGSWFSNAGFRLSSRSVIAWMACWIVQHAANFLTQRGRLGLSRMYKRHSQILSIYRNTSRCFSQMLPQHIKPYHLQTDAALSGVMCLPQTQVISPDALKVMKHRIFKGCCVHVFIGNRGLRP